MEYKENHYDMCHRVDNELYSEFICGSCGNLCDEYTYNEETDTDECNNCKQINEKL